MAKHLVKCLYCGEIFDASVTPYSKPRSNRYAHVKCAENAEQQKTQEEKDKELLEKYIKELFGVSSISIKIKKQMEMFKNEKNYSYSGMYKTLKYFFEIRGNQIEKANGGIGIIPYVYDEAFRYWRAIWEAQQRNENIQVEEYVLPIKEVHIVSPERKPMKHLRRLFTFLDEGGENE